MLAYLVLTGRNGAPVDEESLRRFAVDPPELPFYPTERIVWRNQQGSVVFLGWQAFTDFAGFGSHWAIDERGLTAFSGHCWPQATGWDHSSGRGWASQLRAFLDVRNDPLGARSELFGQFNLVSLDAEGNGFAAPDFMNGDPLYFAEQAGLAVFSNRAGLCARAISTKGTEPERSLTGAGWLICFGSMFDEESGYWDVERLSFGGHIAIDRHRGATPIESTRSPLAPENEATYDEILEDVERELRTTMRVIANLPIADLEFGLSGGKDSRLLTAIIVSEGLRDRFHFVTVGPPEKSDPLAARQVATKLGLNWSLEDRTGRPAAEELEDVLTHTWLVEGISSAWDSAGPTTFVRGATMGGVAGEFLRWGPISQQGTRVSSEVALLQLLRRSDGFDPLGVLRPEVLEYYRRAVAIWATAHLRRGKILKRVASFFMQENRLRARFGPVHTWSAHLCFNPYVTHRVVQANQRLPEAVRPDHRMQIDLMRRCDIELSKLPFADNTWGEATIAHLPDADDYRRIEPVRTASPNAQNWRLTSYRDYRPMLETILLDRENPIHELVRYDRLVEQVAAGDANPGRTRMLWGALTAAVWMGHHERPVKIAP